MRWVCDFRNIYNFKIKLVKINQYFYKIIVRFIDLNKSFDKIENCTVAGYHTF